MTELDTDLSQPTISRSAPIDCSTGAGGITRAKYLDIELVRFVHDVVKSECSGSVALFTGSVAPVSGILPEFGKQAEGADNVGFVSHSVKICNKPYV